MDTALPPLFDDSQFIGPDELADRIGRADAPLLLDVRGETKFLQSTRMLAGAQRCAPSDLAAWTASQPLQEVVVYCVYGHQVSADAVAILRAAGWPARALAGGFEGGEMGVDTPENIQRWRMQRPPSLRKRPDWGVHQITPSRWITRERPKIDRIACPWLIRRFVDSRAQFFYVPTAQVLDDAARLQAVAYDLPGAPVSHQGELCSFDALLTAFEITDPALIKLARIVRGADTDRLELTAQSAGLLAFSLGLSNIHGNDDQSMLEAAMPMYDALYAWCRSAQAEAHSWQPESMTGTAS